MQRRAKVELFEQIRREHELGGVSIRSLARKFGVHHRMVRQALADAIPPERKKRQYPRPTLGPAIDFINQILEGDLKAPRKQRHTAKRIYERVRAELPQVKVAERTVREYVQERKEVLGLARHEVYVPQAYEWGREAQVDWYEAVVELEGAEQKVQIFSMRSMASGGAFHRAYPHATQQAFFEAHERAFEYFGGVFQLLRYDNLASAIKRVLRGYDREQNTRFIAFRSHWRFASEFCNPARGNEKGGVEGEVGYFRRNHLVPVPKVADFAELNRLLLAGCHKDQQRRIGGRVMTVGEGMRRECEHLMAPAAEGFEIAELCFPVVDEKRRARVLTNWYSIPVRPATKVRVLVYPQTVEAWHDGKCVARHQRCYGRGQQVLNLEHYLDILARKPGAFAGSVPLQQWRENGRWTKDFDYLLDSLIERHGKAEGTRTMIELLREAQAYGYRQFAEAVGKALTYGTRDAAAVSYLLKTSRLRPVVPEPLVLPQFKRYDRALPLMSNYDQLLEQEVAR
jgi:transposase